MENCTLENLKAPDGSCWYWNYTRLWVIERSGSQEKVQVFRMMRIILRDEKR
jgi:hypothetical protein